MSFVIEDSLSPYSASTKIYALEQIQTYNNQKRLDFGLDCQRGLVWTEEQKQGLIDTLLYRERIPEIHVIKEDSELLFQVADGKQRLTTILSFLDDKLSWKRKYADKQLHCLFGNRSELFFSELPIHIQSSILSLEVPFATYKNISQKGIVKLFRKLNSGSQLNTFQRNIASNAILRTIYSKEILGHPVLDRIFSNKKLKNDTCEEALVDILVLLLAADANGGEPTAVDIMNTEIFKYNENSFLKDALKLSEEELDDWQATLRTKAKVVNHYLDILGKNKHKLYIISSKAQFLLPILYAYCYNFSDQELLTFYLLLKDVKTKDVVGGGVNYNKCAFRDWFDFIENKVLPQL